MAEYDTLKIKIEADSKSANNSLNKLSTSLENLEKKAKELDTKRLIEVRGLLQSIAKIDFSNVVRGLDSVVKAFKSIERVATKEEKNKAGGMLQVPPKGTASDLSAPDMSKYNVPEVSKEALTSYAELKKSFIEIYDLSKYAPKSFEYTTKAIKKTGDASKKTSNALKKIGDASKKAINPLKKLVNQFKNIMRYRIIRKIIQEIYKALVEGLQNVASFDTGLQDSLGRLQSAFLYLKNSIGAMIAPLIQIVTPALEQLMMIVGDLANEFAELFASMNGQSTFTKATYELKKYNEEAKKTQALGIDELNVLQQDNTGGFVTEEVSLDKEQTETANGLKDILGSIKQLWGEILSIVTKVIEKVKPLLSKIIVPLSNIISIIVRFITNIVDMISDTSNEVLYSLLDAIGTVLTLISNILTLLQPIIDLIGMAIGLIANGLNGTLGFVLNAVSTILGVVNAIVETVIAFFSGDFGKIGEIWGNLIEDIKTKWEGFFTALGNGFKMVAQNFVNFFIRGINFVIGAFENAVNWFIGGIAEIAKWVGVDTSGWGVSFARISEVSFANGGFPEDGMFFANHNELVGQFSNGQTAVANNEQIIEGIKQGVMEAMQASGNNGEIVIKLDSYEIARAMKKQQDNMGADLVVGTNLAWGK